MANKREAKAIQFLVKGNSIKLISRSQFLVRSQSNPQKWYEVTWQRDHWRCECEDYLKRNVRCKHVYGIQYFLAIRDITQGVQDSKNEFACKICGSDKSLVKYGPRHNQSGTVQKFYCKQCNKFSTDRRGYERMKNQTMTIVCALDLFFRGISLREVQQHLQSTFGIDVSYVTIHNWIRKYVELVNNYTKNLKATTSARWHADETLIRVRGRQMVLWCLLDSETRQLIAHHIGQNRGKEEATILFKKGKKSSKTFPFEVVTDGLSSYDEAIAEFAEENHKLGSQQRILHIRGPLTGKINNNKIERFNGSIKGRLKPMGHLNSAAGAKTFGKGYEIHYNFIREHQSLNRRTPAEIAKLSERKMNWRQLIEKASKTRNV